MNPYVFFGMLHAKAGEGSTLKSILLRAAERMHEVNGCQAYLVHADPQDEQAVWVYEVWDDPQAHQNSLEIDFVKEMIAEAMPILDGIPDGSPSFELLGGMGLE